MIGWYGRYGIRSGTTRLVVPLPPRVSSGRTGPLVWPTSSAVLPSTSSWLGCQSAKVRLPSIRTRPESSRASRSRPSATVSSRSPDRFTRSASSTPATWTFVPDAEVVSAARLAGAAAGAGAPTAAEPAELSVAIATSRPNPTAPGSPYGVTSLLPWDRK